MKTKRGPVSPPAVESGNAPGQRLDFLYKQLTDKGMNPKNIHTSMSAKTSQQTLKINADGMAVYTRTQYKENGAQASSVKFEYDQDGRLINIEKSTPENTNNKLIDHASQTLQSGNKPHTGAQPSPTTLKSPSGDTGTHPADKPSGQPQVAPTYIRVRRPRYVRIGGVYFQNGYVWANVPVQPPAGLNTNDHQHNLEFQVPITAMSVVYN